MRSHIKPLEKRQSRGQSLVEFALLIPVLMFVLAGVLDLGRAYYSYVMITNAAREGASYGASNPTNIGSDCTTPGTIKFAACQEAAGSNFALSASNITVTESPDSSSGSSITVTVSVTFHLATGMILGLGEIPLRSSATFQIV